MNTSLKPLLLAMSRVGKKALTPAGQGQYQLHEKNALNSGLDTLVDACAETLTLFLQEYYLKVPVVVQAPRLVDMVTGDAVREIFIEPSCAVSSELRDELLIALATFTEGMVADIGMLFNRPDSQALTPEKSEFIRELIASQVQRHKRKKITKPFVFELNLPGGEVLEIPVQGAFTVVVN